MSIDFIYATNLFLPGLLVDAGLAIPAIGVIIAHWFVHGEFKEEEKYD